METRHGVCLKGAYSYLVFRDERSIKWKIVPTLTPRGRVHSLRLYHRNRYGRRGFHAQCQRAWGTPKCALDLMDYIQRHEKHERQKSIV